MIDTFLFLFGAAVGSFLNVLIDRLPRREGVLWGRSRCENCHTLLPWYDLVPIFSFLLLGGRCRFCHAQIPRRLLLVEILSGVGFALIPGRVGNPAVPTWSEWVMTGCYLLLFSFFLVLFFTDLEHGILPDKIIFAATAVSLAYLLAVEAFPSLAPERRVRFLGTSLTNSVFSGLGLALFFLLLICITRGRGMGFGDVKLGFLIGLVLGWPRVIVAVFLAFLLGSLASVILMAGGRKHFGETVPFGPFLIIGLALAILCGNQLWIWYVGMLGG